MKPIQIEANAIVASFDIDAQNTFTPVCPNELPVPGGNEIVAELNQQAALSRFRLGSKDAHHPNAIWVVDNTHPVLSPVVGKNVDVHWPVHAVPGTQGFELIAGLPGPETYDFFVWKGVELDMHPYGACYHDLTDKMSTGVIEFLQVNQVTTMIVGGLATDYCVKTTVLQLLKAKFQVIVNLAACRGIAEDTVAAALTEMEKSGAVLVEAANAISM